MNPDQTAPFRSGWCAVFTSGSILVVYGAANILVDDKNHTFCDYAL